MAITQRGSATQGTSNSGAGDLDVSVTKPTGVVSGDVLIAIVTTNASAVSSSDSFTSADTETVSTFGCSVWYKVAGGSEPSSYTFTVADNSAGAPFIVQMSAWTGVSNTSPLGDINTTNSGVNESEPYSGPSVTANSAPGRLFYYRGARTSGSPAANLTFSTATGGITELNDGSVSSASGGTAYSSSMYVADSDYTAEGSKSGLAISVAGGSETHNLVSTFTLRAAVNAGHASATGASNSATVTHGPSGSGSAPNATGAGTAYSAEVSVFVPTFGVQDLPDPRDDAPTPLEIFLAEIRRSHVVVSYAEVITPDGEVIRLPAIDGDVKVDRTAAVRRSVDLRCIDPMGELVPTGVDSPLTPYGSEVRPYRGVMYDDGTEEVFPLGVFRISKVSVSDTTGGSPEIAIEGFDRSRTISRDKFTVPYTIDEGANVITAIIDIVKRTYPEIVYDSISSETVTTAPKVYDANNDPWDAVTELALSVGCDIYFDVSGRLVVAPPEDMDALTEADFSYIEGQGNTMTDLDQVLSDDPGFNGVIVTGESPGDELPPVRGEAWDEDESSATYRYGPYGEVPTFHQDTTITTDEDAEAVAKSMLANLIGFSSQLDVTATVNPTYECGQTVEVVRSRSNISGLYVIDAFNVPLRAAETQKLVLRKKRQAST